MRGSVSAVGRGHRQDRVEVLHHREEGRDHRPSPGRQAQVGPAGLGVWSAPTVDPRRGLVYVTTGDSFTVPAEPLSDSVIALSLKTGKAVWHYQATANDSYMTGCQRGGGPNCPETNGPDYDFGSSMVLQDPARRQADPGRRAQGRRGHGAGSRPQGQAAVVRDPGAQDGHGQGRHRVRRRPWTISRLLRPAGEPGPGIVSISPRAGRSGSRRRRRRPTGPRARAAPPP